MELCKTCAEKRLQERVAQLRKQCPKPPVGFYAGICLSRFDKEDLIRIMAIATKEAEAAFECHNMVMPSIYGPSFEKG